MTLKPSIPELKLFTMAETLTEAAVELERQGQYEAASSLYSTAAGHLRKGMRGLDTSHPLYANTMSEFVTTWIKALTNVLVCAMREGIADPDMSEEMKYLMVEVLKNR